MKGIQIIYCALVMASGISIISARWSRENAGSSVASANNDFSQDMYLNLVATNKQNSIYSPLSLHLILGLASYGADKETKTSMAKGLRLSHSDALLKDYSSLMEDFKQYEELKIADKIFIAKDLKVDPKFQKIAKEQFLSEIGSVDFSKNNQAAKEMNNWVEDQTNKKIKDLIKPDAINQQTRMVLINAIHFKDAWSSSFPAEATKIKPFYTDEKSYNNVSTMHQTDDFQMYEEAGNDGFKVIELPYQRRGVSMYIFLPNQKTGLPALEKKLFQSKEGFNKKLEDIIEKTELTQVELALPKFKIESSWDLKELCEKIGMGVIFSEKADFTALTANKEPLSVSKVIQKAVIEVNEVGTEAAAATAILVAFASLPIRPSKQAAFIADHPFLFALRSEPNKAVLFMGAVNNPQSKAVRK